MPTGRAPSFMANAGNVAPQWHHVDASDKVLGRLATNIATVLMGKHKPTYTPHVDTGDFVVVTNVEKIKLTGTSKLRSMRYDRYTYHPGGFHRVTGDTMMERHPDRILYFAVKRMLPKNALGRRMLKKLKLFTGAEHSHAAQQPKAWAY